MAAAYAEKPALANLLADKTVLLNIFEAAAIGKLSQIVRLLAKNPENVNLYAQDGSQPLELAAYFGHDEVVDYLLKAGALVNSEQKNKEQLTPLHAATVSGNLKTVRLLIAHGAALDVSQKDKLTPLHIAAENGNTSIVRLLLFNGADQKSQSINGKTPLDFALENGHEETLRLLKQGITKRFRSARKISSRL